MRMGACIDGTWLCLDCPLSFDSAEEFQAHTCEPLTVEELDAAYERALRKGVR